MTPDDITTALLQQYGSRQRPLLLNPAPALAGLPQGSAVNIPTPQPVLPQVGQVAVPKVQRNDDAMQLLRALSGGGQPQQPSPDMSGMGTALGGLLKNQFSPGGFLSQLTGSNGAGYGGLFGAAAPTVHSIPMAGATIGNLQIPF